MTLPKTLRDVSGLGTDAPSLHGSALVMIDLQNTYREGVMKLDGVEPAILEAQKLLHRAREAGIPIFHIQHDAGAGSPYDVGARIGAISDEVAPQAGETTIVKNYPNAFIGTDLQAKLEATGVKDVILAGFMTHMCINSTARGAFNLGFRPDDRRRHHRHARPARRRRQRGAGLGAPGGEPGCRGRSFRRREGAGKRYPRLIPIAAAYGPDACRAIAAPVCGVHRRRWATSAFAFPASPAFAISKRSEGRMDRRLFLASLGASAAIAGVAPAAFSDLRPGPTCLRSYLAGHRCRRWSRRTNSSPGR